MNPMTHFTLTGLLCLTLHTQAQTITKPTPAGSVDEPFSLPGQTYTTSKLFTATTVKRQANRCPITVHKGHVYAIYARQGDERMMVAKIPLDGSPAVIQPLCPDSNAPGAILSENNHKVWVIQVDRAGYVHICGNMHTSPTVLFWRSNKPEDISAFTYSVGNPAIDVPIAGGPSFPTLRSAPNGQIFWNAQQGTPSLSSYDESTKK